MKINLTEILILASLICSALLALSALYVAMHFIIKVW